MVNLSPALITLNAPDLTIAEDVVVGLVRARIMSKIGLRLQRITPGNGFYTNIGSQVRYGKAMSSQPPVPSINYYDDIEHGVRQTYDQETRELSVTFECFEQWNQEGQVPDVMEVLAGQMIADVEMAITRSHRPPYNIDTVFDELATGMNYEQSTILISLPPYYWVGALIAWTINYETVLANPFLTPKEQTITEEED